MARAEQEADLETAEDYRQRTVWNKLVGWLQLEGRPLRLGASWCSDDAGLAAVGAYLVLQKKTTLYKKTAFLWYERMNMVYEALQDLILLLASPILCYTTPATTSATLGCFPIHMLSLSPKHGFPTPSFDNSLSSGASLKATSLDPLYDDCQNGSTYEMFPSDYFSDNSCFTTPNHATC